MKITNASNNGIHNGLVTHTHDQVATTPQPPNFKTKNIRNKITPIPNPPSFLLFSDMMSMYEMEFRKPNLFVKS